MNRELLDAFSRCAGNAALDEVHVACLVARALDPAVDNAAVERSLQALADRQPADTTPWSFMADEGFAGNADDYGALLNSNLAWVLEKRRGIPITLGVVLMGVARRAGHSAVGINFPGHFLVQVDDVLVDPFLLKPANRTELVEQLPARSRGAANPRALFAPASAVAVGLRMLNNVKLGYARLAAWDRALDILDAQLELAPSQGALHLERGDLWTRLGMAGQARAAFQRALALADQLPAMEGESLRTAASERLDQLGDAGDVVH